MFATVPRRLTSTVIGSCMRPLASARSLSRPIAARTCGACTVGASTTTLAGSAAPGNACLHAVVGLHDRERLRERVWPRRDHLQLERRRRERDQQPTGDDDREHRPAQDAVDDRTPDAAVAVVAAEAPDERDAKPVDLVPEPREERREHGQRAQHRDRDDHHRREPEGRERRVAGQEQARPWPPSRSGRRSGPSGPTSPPRPRLPPARCGRRPVPRVRASSRTSSSRRPPRARSGARARRPPPPPA